MALQTYKVKSLSPDHTAEQLKSGYSTRFLSFESAIDLFKRLYPTITDEPVGYKVTEQGIEILYK